MRSRGVPFGDNLSRENEDSLEALSGKVAALRALSYDIEGEVQAQTHLLDDMDGSFGGARQLLAATTGKLAAMLSAGGNRHMWSGAGAGEYQPAHGGVGIVGTLRALSVPSSFSSMRA